MHKSEIQAQKDLNTYQKWLERYNYKKDGVKVSYALAPIINDRYFLFDLYQIKVVDTATGRTLSTSIVEIKERNIPIDKHKTAIIDLEKVRNMQEYSITHNVEAYIVNFYPINNILTIHTLDKNKDYSLNAEWKENINMETVDKERKGSKYVVHFPIDEAKKYFIDI